MVIHWRTNVNALGVGLHQLHFLVPIIVVGQ